MDPVPVDSGRTGRKLQDLILAFFEENKIGIETEDNFFPDWLADIGPALRETYQGIALQILVSPSTPAHVAGFDASVILEQFSRISGTLLGYQQPAATALANFITTEEVEIAINYYFPEDGMAEKYDTQDGDGYNGDDQYYGDNS